MKKIFVKTGWAWALGQRTFAVGMRSTVNYGSDRATQWLDEKENWKAISILSLFASNQIFFNTSLVNRLYYFTSTACML